MACSCGANRTSYTQIVANDKSSLPLLKYLQCKYKSQFTFVFAKVGIAANESNLHLLAKASDTGQDKAGAIKGPNGQPIYFSVEEQLKLIDPKNVENNTCSI